MLISGVPPGFVIFFSAIASSTVLLVCQKSRYGEIVVPKNRYDDVEKISIEFNVGDQGGLKCLAPWDRDE